MYNPQKLSKLAAQMSETTSEKRIIGLAQQEYRTVTIISDKIESVAQSLRDDGLLNLQQAQLLKSFRKHVYYLHFALQDIIHNKTKRSMEEKISYLKKMIVSYEKELAELEKVLGDDIKHVKGALDKLQYSLMTVERFE
ncbi:hypothetical protein KY363_02115 [Candidatus Woesearchaeota archaeon]|nr:hypothetical protein [Candidatus Woesearchaeota archaeon]